MSWIFFIFVVIGILNSLIKKWYNISFLHIFKPQKAYFSLIQITTALRNNNFIKTNHSDVTMVVYYNWYIAWEFKLKITSYKDT